MVTYKKYCQSSCNLTPTITRSWKCSGSSRVLDNSTDYMSWWSWLVFLVLSANGRWPCLHQSSPRQFRQGSCTPLALFLSIANCDIIESTSLTVSDRTIQLRTAIGSCTVFLYSLVFVFQFHLTNCTNCTFVTSKHNENVHIKTLPINEKINANFHLHVNV